MIAVDTNVLVRFLVLDDPGQGAAARKLLAACTEEAPAFVAREVLLELVWVLERAYRFPRGKIADALDGLLAAEEMIVENLDSTALALERYRNDGADFADQMIAGAAMSVGCTQLHTFDKRAARYPEITLITTA